MSHDSSAPNGMKCILYSNPDGTEIPPPDGYGLPFTLNNSEEDIESKEAFFTDRFASSKNSTLKSTKREAPVSLEKSKATELDNILPMPSTVPTS